MYIAFKKFRNAAQFELILFATLKNLLNYSSVYLEH